VYRLLIVSAFLVILSGCGLVVDRDVRAYNTCLARHPQDTVVCEGPRQAYEVDPYIVQARSATGRPTAGYGNGEGLAVPNRSLTPVSLHPSSMPNTTDPNGSAHRLNQAWR
jgi:hypothetical protein